MIENNNRDSEKLINVRVVLLGYGGVGREIIRLIEEKGQYLREKYGMDIVLTEVIGSRGCVYQEDGIDINRLLCCGTGSMGIIRYCSENGLASCSEPIFEGDVFIDAAPTDIVSGQPELDNIMRAIENKMNIVAVAKGALVVGLKSIMEAARDMGVCVKYSGATAAALPAIDMGQYCLAGTKILSIEGILNGTTNYILTSMFEKDMSFEEALAAAKRKGIAEANCELDIRGIDSACKILLLANSLLGTEYGIKDVDIEGIEKISGEDVRRAKERNSVIKLTAGAYKEGEGFKLKVKPVEIADESLLYGISGTNKGIVFETDTMGCVAALGGSSNPRGAAAAALKDIINIYR